MHHRIKRLDYFNQGVHCLILSPAFQSLESNMPHRLSKAARRKLAALMRRQNKRLNADPAFRAAASERMKRRRADPAFNAIWLAAMKRLHADPKYTAAKRARTKRLYASPAFRAKLVAAGVLIPPARRAAIIAALRADPHAKRVARLVGGASYQTVLRVAKAARIKLHKSKLTPPQQREAIRRRDLGEPLGAIARSYNVHPSTICRLPTDVA